MSGLIYQISNSVRELTIHMRTPFTFLTSLEASSSSTIQEIFTQLNITKGALDRGIHVKFGEMSAILISVGQYETVQKVIEFVPSVMEKLTKIFDDMFTIKADSINSLNHAGYSLSQATMCTALGAILTTIGACQLSEKIFRAPNSKANDGTSKWMTQDYVSVGLTVIGAALFTYSVIITRQASLKCFNVATNLQKL